MQTARLLCNFERWYTRSAGRPGSPASLARGFFVSGGTMERYDPQQIEAKWQRVWQESRAFHTADPEPGASREQKFYMLEMLPYPSGQLHMGHVLNYTLGDVVTHFQRRNGRTVLRPMG